MIKALISDLSRTILFPKDESYSGGLNALHNLHAEDFEYDFWSYYKLNEEYLSYLETIKAKFPLYVFTSGLIQEYPSLKDILQKYFKEMYSSEKIGLKKDDPASFRLILSQLNLEPQEVIFIDDEDSFLKAAKEAGLKQIKFTKNAEVIKKIRELIENPETVC